MEFILELLREERNKRQAAEEEVKLLRQMLEPLQQKVMDRIIENRKAVMKKCYEETEEETKGKEVRNSNPRRGRIVCDCGCDDHLEENKATSSGSNFDGYDELD